MHPLILIGFTAGAFIGFRWLRRERPDLLQRWLRRYGLWVAVGVLVLLVASGRMSPVLALLGGLFSFLLRAQRLLAYLPLLQRIVGLATATDRQAPEVDIPDSIPRFDARCLSVWLDPAKETVDGIIRQGSLSGRSLTKLSAEQVQQQVRAWFPSEAPSARLMQAFADLTGAAPADMDLESGRSDPALTRAEAAAILAVPEHADDATVTASHRRLMQKLHPDRGGSAYLATKVNIAKDLLLKRS